MLRAHDWLQAHGFDAMAAKLGTWLDGGLDDQQRADLFVADLVRSARAYVAGKRGKRGNVGPDTMLSGTLAEDVARQEKWLAREAKSRGYSDIDQLAERNYPLFEKLAELWRKKNPAKNGVLLSRKYMPLVSAQSDLDAAIKEAGKDLQKAIDNKRASGRVVLGRSPHVLSMLAGKGVESPRPMIVESGILNKSVAEPGSVTSKSAGKHFGDLEGVSGEELARAMYRPAAVIEDMAQAGNLTIVTNILTKDGPLVVNVNTAGTMLVGGRDVPAVLINSIYARKRGEVGLWLNGKEFNAKGGIEDSKRVVHYIDQTQIGEAVTGKLNPENKNPAFKGRDLVSALGAVNMSSALPRSTLSPISLTDDSVPEFGSPANQNYRGLATVGAGIQRWVTGKGLKPGLKPAKTYGQLLAWIGKQYKGDVADKPIFSRGIQTSTPAFKAWFGNSKVVDSNGKPLVVYHGAKTGDIAEFGPATYFSEDADEASDYSKARGANSTVYPVFIKIENPYEASDESDHENRSELTGIDEAYAAELASSGYDGVISRRNGVTLWAIPFSPAQIKSAIGNNGEFNPGNADTRMSRAPAQATVAERADAIIQTKAATAKPIDALAHGLTRITGVERLTRAIYGRAGYLLDRYTPETIKAGLVSDYGVPEAVIDQRALMQGRQRVQLRQAGNLIDKLATLTRAESRVAYEWMRQGMRSIPIEQSRGESLLNLLHPPLRAPATEKERDRVGVYRGCQAGVRQQGVGLGYRAVLQSHWASSPCAFLPGAARKRLTPLGSFCPTIADRSCLLALERGKADTD